MKTTMQDVINNELDICANLSSDFINENDKVITQTEFLYMAIDHLAKFIKDKKMSNECFESIFPSLNQSDGNDVIMYNFLSLKLQNKGEL